MFNRLHPADKFLCNPNEPAAAPAASTSAPTEPTATTTPAASATATAVPSGATTPSAGQQTSAAPASSGAASSAAGTSTPAAPAAPSWLEGFRSEGVTFTDETQARQALIQSYRDAERLRPLAPTLSAYQQNAAQFNEWLAEKQKASQKPSQQADWTAELGWNPPPYDLNQLRLQITQDAQGNMVPVAGAPADVVSKYQAVQAFRQEQVEKLLTNPYKFMEPAIRKIAGEMASQQAQQGVGQYREQQEAQSFISQHSNWLFEAGADGKPKTTAVINPQTGRYESQQVLSQWGKHFREQLELANSRGLPPDLQQEFALRSVQNAYMASPEYRNYLISQNQPAATAAAAPAAPAATPRQAANAAFTQRANPAAPPQPNGGSAVPAPQKIDRNNLEQVMLNRFREAGVTV